MKYSAARHVPVPERTAWERFRRELSENVCCGFGINPSRILGFDSYALKIGQGGVLSCVIDYTVGEPTLTHDEMQLRNGCAADRVHPTEAQKNAGQSFHGAVKYPPFLAQRGIYVGLELYTF